MSILLPYQKPMSGQTDVRSSTPLPLPIVYEKVPVAPAHWEYRVLTIDTREEALPDGARLNELGSEGWLLVGMLDQQAGGSSRFVQYYFVRQKIE